MLHHKILIPIRFCSPFCVKFASLSLLIWFLFITQFLSLSIDSNTKPPIRENPNLKMKVHPLPKKRNITIQYPQGISLNGNKKLRRLPHIFSRVLELPFRSDAEVNVEESHECFRFTAEADDIGDVRAHMIEIHPGVTKIVVRTIGHLEISTLDELELDMWRFRLPESTRPEHASAVFVDGELIVTVPKGGNGEEEDEEVWGDSNGGGFRGNTNNNRLVLVQ